MDNNICQPGSKAHQPNILLASLKIFNSILHWLAGLIRLTAEEQDAAGIYLGHHG